MDKPDMDKKEMKTLFERLSSLQNQPEQWKKELQFELEKIQQVNQRYTDFFYHAPAGYLIIDQHYKVEEVNNMACRLLEKEREGVLGADFSKLIDPGFLDTFLIFVKDTKAGKADSGCNLQIKKTKGSFFVRLFARRVALEKSGDQYFILAFFENSKEKELETALEDEKRKLRESERLKSAFLTNMSHEIRTPMNGILGFADLLKEPELTPGNLQKYIDVIQHSGKRMLGIINDLIDVSRIEGGSVNVVKVNTNLNDLVEYIFAFFQPEAQKRGLELQVKMSLNPRGNSIETDKEKVYAVFSNLLKNAINYTEKGHIVFGCREKENAVECFVEDTGIGISAEDREAIFERFYRASNGAQKSKGAGLGLSIAKAYVEMLGGTISVKSQEGKGSTFFFTLPCEGCSEEISEKDSVADTYKKPGDPLSELNVLVAEDDEVARIYLAELLEGKCRGVLFAKNGREAVNLYQSNKIDLVLMDIKMPVMDGYTAAIKIKEFDKKAVIIAQTAYALAADREKALAAGCNDYLAKPLMKKDLFSVIERYFK